MDDNWWQNKTNNDYEKNSRLLLLIGIVGIP